MEEEENVNVNGHEPTNNPYRDYQQLWYSPTREEYQQLRAENPFYDGGREVQFANIFGGEIEFVVQHFNLPSIEYCHETITGEGEYKAEEENQWGKYGNLFIEIEQRFPLPFGGYTEWQPSGLSRTTANVWIHQCFSNGVPHLPFVIPVETLKKWIIENNFAEVVAPHEFTSGTENRGILVPIQFVLQHYPLPVNNEEYVELLLQKRSEKTVNQLNNEERLKQLHKRAKEVLGTTTFERVYGEDVEVETLLNGNYFVTYTSSNGETFTQLYNQSWQPIQGEE